MTKLFIDRETFGDRDLPEVGAYRYAETAYDLLVAYAIDDGQAKVWDCTVEPFPPDDLVEACETADEVWAHNAQFDRIMHEAQRDLPQIPLEKWRCSMAQALSHALPAGLGDLCRVLKVPEEQSKLAEGDALVKLFTRLQPRNRKIRHATRTTHPRHWARFIAYATNDIVSMRECIRRMPRINWDASAIAEWHCDQRMNDRGFYVDRELVEAGARAATNEKEYIARRFLELSEGEFKPTQREKFKAYLNDHGVMVDNTQSETFQQLLKRRETLPGHVAEMMELSISANKTSTAKYAALKPMLQDDNRFRGALQFAGAGRTRRWAGRGPQFQNLPARGLPPKEEVDAYIEHLKEDTHELFHTNLMLLGAAALRGIVVSTP